MLLIWFFCCCFCSLFCFCYYKWLRARIMSLLLLLLVCASVVGINPWLFEYGTVQKCRIHKGKENYNTDSHLFIQRRAKYEWHIKWKKQNEHQIIIRYREFAYNQSLSIKSMRQKWTSAQMMGKSIWMFMNFSFWMQHFRDGFKIIVCVGENENREIWTGKKKQQANFFRLWQKQETGQKPHANGKRHDALFIWLLLLINSVANKMENMIIVWNKFCA